MGLLEIIEAAGASLERTVMGHLDRTVFDVRGLLEIAATGCYVAFDLFGRESSYYPQAVFDLPNDAIRLKLHGGFGGGRSWEPAASVTGPRVAALLAQVWRVRVRQPARERRPAYAEKGLRQRNRSGGSLSRIRGGC